MSLARIVLLPILSSPFLTAASVPAQEALPVPGEERAIGDPLTVVGVFKLNDTIQPFLRTLGENDDFGSAIASLGDLNGDGNREYAIGAPGDFGDRGAVWIFSLRPDRTVATYVKYAQIERLPFSLDVGDRFGTSVTALGDLDGDGIGDIAVGAPGDDDGLEPPFSNGGAVYLLFLGADGGVRTSVKFSRTSGGFPGLLDAGDAFGTSVTSLGDLDGNGVQDLLVGTPNDDDGGGNRGAAWVLFLGPNHQVVSTRKISQTQGGFGGTLPFGARFGSSLANLGDLDGDGNIEVAVGTARADTDNYWIISLAADGSVVHEVAGSAGMLNEVVSVVRLGDVDGDGVTDMALGSSRQTLGLGRFAVVFLNADGSQKGISLTITSTALEDSDFGQALATPGDTDGDGRPEILVGVPAYSQRAVGMGGMVIFNLGPGGHPVGPSYLIDAVTAGVPVAPRFALEPPSFYGTAIAPLGDVDGDGFAEVAVGSPGDSDGANGTGAVWIHHFSQTDARRVDKVSKPFGNLPLAPGDAFGSALANVGDLDGNGVIDLAVGAPSTGAAGSRIWIVFLNRFSRVQSMRAITMAEGGFASRIGGYLDSVGDFDGDGVTDLIAGGESGGPDPERRILLLNPDGSVKSSFALSRAGVTGTVPGDGFGRRVSDGGPRAEGGRRLLVRGGGSLWLVDYDRSGVAVESARLTLGTSDAVSVGDLDGDGVRDIAAVVNHLVGLYLMRSNFTVRQSQSFGAGRNPIALTALGDVTRDGVPDIAGSTRFGPGRSAFLSQLGGVATIDFEHRVDGDASVMENGRAVPPVTIGSIVTITSEGANLGAAAFDSTQGGPNNFSQDPDLLVGSGKVLILQDSLHGTQTRPGIYDRPNDDADGGVLHFTFHALVRPLSIRLIDIDPGFEQRATVTLVDDAGRTRIYDVPGGFTEDRVINGGTGWRMLDLTKLGPQQGFMATATALYMPGFDERRVTRIDVELGSSGAVDDLVYDPYP